MLSTDSKWLAKFLFIERFFTMVMVMSWIELKPVAKHHSNTFRIPSHLSHVSFLSPNSILSQQFLVCNHVTWRPCFCSWPPTWLSWCHVQTSNTFNVQCNIEKRLWGLTNWSPKGNTLIFYWILPTNFLWKCTAEISLEDLFVDIGALTL